MPKKIPGINRTALWTAWKAIRKDLRRSAKRDIVDFLEYDVDPDVWINRLLKQLDTRTYEPAAPGRFYLAKSNGFSRRMTTPAIPDLVLYRAIVDLLYAKAKGHEKKHAYFERSQLHKVTAKAFRTAQQDMDQVASSSVPYAMALSAFLVWLRYDQYRKYLIFKELSPYIVITDITNFFDSILHMRIAESLHKIAVPPRIIGLLFFILERLAVRETYSESPRIGLSVDEFGCSRTLAHMVLFSHDDEMANLVGEDSYVRWADDQTFAVATRADGLAVLSEANKSLAKLNLTPNAAKSKILTLSQARRHFHLDFNEMLDDADPMPHGTSKEQQLKRQAIRNIWKSAKQYEGVGEWVKILNRIYRLSAQSKSRQLRQRAVEDILTYPTLAKRVADYMRSTGSVNEFISFADDLWGHPEQLYEDVSLLVFEVFLRLECNKNEARLIRNIASSFLSGKKQIPGKRHCADVAPLAILRFGDRRSLPLLRSIFEERRSPPSLETIRSAAVVYASYGYAEFRVVRDMASKLQRNNLADVVRLVDRIGKYEQVPNRYKARMNLHFDDILGRKFVDMRSVVAARLLRFSNATDVVTWIKSEKDALVSDVSISRFDRGLAARLYP